MTGSRRISRVEAWKMAIRPKTLPAAISPVLVGSALAAADKGFRLPPALAAFAGALLLQIGVNVANDYFDYIKGIDTPDRLGPLRVTQSGLISPRGMKAGMAVIFSLALMDGLYLVTIAGWPIALVGLASILSALAYSGGPYPLASHGLGDIFVFIFFGLAAVCGTYYVQTIGLPLTAWLMAVPVGLLITAILVVNNLRDIDTDRRTEKYTLAVILGVNGARIEYTLLIISAYASPLLCIFSPDISAWVALVLLSLPLACRMMSGTWKESGTSLNLVLAGTARLTFFFSLLLSAGLLISSL